MGKYFRSEREETVTKMITVEVEKRTEIFGKVLANQTCRHKEGIEFPVWIIRSKLSIHTTTLPSSSGIGVNCFNNERVMLKHIRVVKGNTGAFKLLLVILDLVLKFLWDVSLQACRDLGLNNVINLQRYLLLNCYLVSLVSKNKQEHAKILWSLN